MSPSEPDPEKNIAAQVADPRRLRALHRLALLDTPTEQSFDRLSRLAARLFKAPVALVSLVDANRQFFKSSVGLPEPWAARRETPLSHSFCQHVVATGQPLVVDDARRDPLLKNNRAVDELNVIAYLGIPLRTKTGEVLGSFCVIDSQPRQWGVEEVSLLGELAGSVMTEIELRQEIAAGLRAKAALQQSEARLQRLAAQVPGMIYTFRLRPDGAMSFPYVSAGVRDLYELEPEEVQRDAAKLLGMIHPDDRPDFERSVALSARTLEPWSWTGRAVFPSGKIKWLQCASRPERHANGDIVWDGIVLDATEHRLAAQALTEERELLRTLIDSLPMAIYVKDLQARFVITNEFNSKLLGVTTAEAVGKTAFDFFPREIAEPYFADDQSVVQTGAPVQNREEAFATANGQQGWFLTTKVPLRNRAGKIIGLVGVSRDITARRQAQLEQQQLERKLLEAQKLESLGILAGGIAHDFNNLLAGILGNACLAADELPADHAVQHSLSQIESAAVRGGELCQQMLAYSGRGRFVIAPVDLGKLVQETARLLQVSLGKKAVLNFNLAAELPPVRVNVTQIRQIVMNLVINAAEALGENEGVIRLSTGVMHADQKWLDQAHLGRGLPAGDYVFLEIQDTGCGMSPEIISKIFDPFFTTKFTGRGLGLAAVHGIVRGHKGALHVQSEPGRGSTFRLVLPRAIQPPDAPPPPSTAPTTWKGKGNALVVDDEEALRMVAARMLEKLGFTVTVASNGQEALEKFRAPGVKFDVVLLDVTMPRMNGVETFHELRRLRPTLPVLMMSGYDSEAAASCFTGPAPAGFLHKPFKFESLCERLREFWK